MGLPSPWSERAVAVKSTVSINVSQMRCQHSLMLRWSDRIFSAFPHVIIFSLGTAGLCIFIGLVSSSIFEIVVWFLLYILLVVTVFMFASILMIVGKGKLNSSVIDVRCQRCPKCFYDLSNRPRTDDICPECGVVAPRRECVRLWCKLLRSRF